jgi:hypothetical protein
MLHKNRRRRAFPRGVINLDEWRRECEREREDRLVQRLADMAIASREALSFDRSEPHFLAWLRRQNKAAKRCGFSAPLYDDLVREFARVTDPSKPTDREVMAGPEIEELAEVMKTYAVKIDKRKPTPMLDPHNLSLPQIDAFLEKAYVALNNALEICGLEGLPNWRTRH